MLVCCVEGGIRVVTLCTQYNISLINLRILILEFLEEFLNS